MIQKFAKNVFKSSSFVEFYTDKLSNKWIFVQVIQLISRTKNTSGYE